MENLTVGDIVQITDESDDWFPSLCIVDEVKEWGIQCYLFVPKKGTAFYRVKNGQFEKVGTAVFTIQN